MGIQQDLNSVSSSCTLTGKTNGSHYQLLISGWPKPFENYSSVTPLWYLQEQQTNRPQESRYLLMSQPSTTNSLFESLLSSVETEQALFLSFLLNQHLQFPEAFLFSPLNQHILLPETFLLLVAHISAASFTRDKQDWRPKHSPYLPFPTPLVAPQPCQLLPVLLNTPLCKESLAKHVTIRHQCTSHIFASAQNTPSLYLSRG